MAVYPPRDRPRARKGPVNALGVGNTYAYEIEPSKTAPLVDILVYHDYFETRSRVRNVCEIMKRLSEQYHKPVINNETCCLCRSNPYDMALEILQEYHFGFYVFELMIGNDMWQRVHGICYPDGTVRDPSIVAAVQGFFRNRTSSALPENVNEEGSADLAIRLATKALSDTADRWNRDNKRRPNSFWRPPNTSATCWRRASMCPCTFRRRPASKHTAPRKIRTWRKSAHGYMSSLASCATHAAWWARGATNNRA